MPLNKVMRLNFLWTIKKSKINFFFFQTIILFIKSNDFAVFWNYLFSWYNVAFVCQAKRVSIKEKVVKKTTVSFAQRNQMVEFYETGVWTMKYHHRLNVFTSTRCQLNTQNIRNGNLVSFQSYPKKEREIREKDKNRRRNSSTRTSNK